MASSEQVSSLPSHVCYPRKTDHAPRRFSFPKGWTAKVDALGRVEHIRAMTGPGNADIERLRAHFASCPSIRLAVLFGSRASGTPRPSSDYDIGMLPRDPELSLADELRLGSALSGLVAHEVDLVRLDRDNPLLGREIAMNGICLYEAELGAFTAYRAAAVSRWLDFDETIRPHRNAFLRRLANG
jgi:predicted nucleotidyltransferase